MKKAEFIPRLIAWAVDSTIIGILVFVIMLVFGLVISVPARGESNLSGFLAATAAIVMLVILFFIQFLYFGYLWSKTGQSLGMKLINIKVLRRDGKQQSFLRAALRGTIGYWLSGAIFNLGYLWAAFDANRETWHDKIFDSQVVDMKK